MQTLLAIIEKKDAQIESVKDQNTNLKDIVKEAQAGRDEWKNLYLERGKAIDDLKKSLEAKQGEVAQTNIAKERLLEQQKEDAALIASQDRKILKQKVQTFLFSAGSAAAGYGVCRATNR